MFSAYLFGDSGRSRMSLTKAAANDRHGGRSLEIVSEDSYGIETGTKDFLRSVQRTTHPKSTSRIYLSSSL